MNDAFRKYNNTAQIVGMQIAMVFKEYQNYVDSSIKDVKMDIGDLYQHKEMMGEALKELSANALMASSKEEDFMNEVLVELKQRTNDMNTKVHDLDKKLAVMDQKFSGRLDSIDNTLKEIKEIQKEQVSSKRYKFTTTIQIIASVVAAISAVAAVVKLFS